jgi:hypothetical protein
MIDFSWFLPEVGHEVVPKPVAVSAETDIDALWIRPVEQSTSSANAWRRYTLIQSEGGLFRRFAAIEFKPQSIVEFADQYGLLTDSRRGEPLSVWKAAIEEMEYVVAYWERARQLGIPLYPCDDKVTFFTKEAIEDATSFADSSDDSIARVIPLSTRSTDHGDDCTTNSHRAINFVPDRMNRHDALGMIASRIRKNLSSTRIGFRTFESETKLHGLTLRLFPATLCTGSERR